MKTFATVIAVTDTYALVETNRVSACEECHKATEEGGCSVCTLMGGSQKISAKADNTLGAKVGDRVVIESATGRVLWYALLVFVLPLLCAAAAYGIFTLAGLSAEWRLIGSLCGLVGTFLGVFAYSEIVRKKHCDVKITEICHEQVTDTENKMG